MSLTVKEKGGDFKQVPAGTYTAICNAIIDLGSQDGPYGIKPQIYLRWEIPGETIEIDGQDQPMVLGSFYTASLSEKANLRRDLESWRGRAFTREELDGFNIKALLGKPCTLSVYHNEEGMVQVRGVSPVMKGVDVPPQQNASIWFDLDHHDEGSKEFSDVPYWLRDIIAKRVSAASEDPAPPGVERSYHGWQVPELGEDIPFVWAIAAISGMGMLDAAQAML